MLAAHESLSDAAMVVEVRLAELSSDAMRLTLLTALLLLSVSPLQAADKPDAHLSSGEYFIRQSWSQEHDFPRPYHVHVPANPDHRKLPVFIFLHGNGGTALGTMPGFLRQHPTMAARYVMVFPDGYLKSWNIVAERSKADDRTFI